MTLAKLLSLLLFGFAVFGAAARSALAEVDEVRLARQYGIVYLPLMIMEHDKLIEKQAKLAGVSVEAKFVQIGSTSMMNSALLSDTLDFGAVAAPGIAFLWDKTRGGPSEVRTVASIGSLPMSLNCRDPNVKSIRDLTKKDRIALLAPKVSVYAMVLEMAAAQVFGEENYTRLDTMTVGFTHPDGTQALLSGAAEVTCHFTAPPYSNEELAKPGIHTILRANDILGEGVAIVMLMSTTRFRTMNPKTFAAVFAAMQVADQIIARNKTYAAQVYVEMTKTKEPVDEVLTILNDPQVEFTATPRGITKYTDFMFRHGLIKTKLSSWKDLCFPEAQSLPGN